MALPQLLGRWGKGQAAPPPPHYLALHFSEETVQAAVWHKVGDVSTIVRWGTLQEYRAKEDLLAAADTTVSEALETVTPEPSEVLLGLPESWVEGDKISTDKQPLLKEVLKGLELTALGFAVRTETIVEWLKKKEGTPLSAILIELGETEATVSVIKVGKILGSHTVGRSEDLGADVEEGLARFQVSDAFPSRMILTDSHLDLEAARQTLLSYSWQEKLPFLHVPKVELLDKSIPLIALVGAGGAQVVKAEMPLTLQATDEHELEAYGFFKGEDVRGKQAPPKPHTELKTEALTPSLAASSATAVSPMATVTALIGRVGQRLSHLFSAWRAQPKSKLPLVAFGVVFLLMLLGLILLPQAEVTLSIAPTVVTEQRAFTVVGGGATDASKEILGGKTVEVEIEDSLEKETTGELTTGEKAKGEVTLFNKTSSPKKFAAATIVATTGGIEFTIDSEVTVASQSAQTGTWGMATAGATAVKPGTAGNISEDTTLSVKGFGADSYGARAAKNFAGGTSITINAVAEEDHDSLLEELTTSLETKASEELAEELPPGETLVTDVETEIISRQFTRAVDEEADSVGLTLKLRVRGLTFLSTDALLLIQEALAQGVPAGFMSLPDSARVDIREATIEDNTAQVTANIQSLFVPQYDVAAIIRSLRGKKAASAQSLLTTLPSVKRVEVVLTPKVFGWLNLFPFRSEHIRLVLRANP